MTSKYFLRCHIQSFSLSLSLSLTLSDLLFALLLRRIGRVQKTEELSAELQDIEDAINATRHSFESLAKVFRFFFFWSHSVFPLYLVCPSMWVPETPYVCVYVCPAYALL